MNDTLGFILWILSIVIKILLTVPMVSYGMYKAIGRKKLGNYFKNIAIAVDVLGNVMGGDLFNTCIIKKGIRFYSFGSRFDTFSYVLGKNNEIGSLNKLGIFIVKVLDFMDKDHVQKAIQIGLIIVTGLIILN